MEIQRRAGQQHARQATEQERRDEADRERRRCLERQLAFHIVPIQLKKNLMPVGTAIRNVMKLKKGSRTAPVAYMWCAHTATDSAAMPRVA